MVTSDMIAAPEVKVASVTERIRTWANTELKYWEQLALEKIATGNILSDADEHELVEAFLVDAGVAQATRKPLTFPIDPPLQSSRKSYRLERIFDLENVNALPKGQEIKFGSQLTLIYGGNGAGKTGYARPLACAAFARGEREVLPNATLPKPKDSPSAKIEMSCNGVTETFTWTDGSRLSELDGFYAFDANSLKAHLTQANSLQFTPAALALLARLAELTDRVRARVRRLTDQWEAPLDSAPWFDGESDISRMVANLSADADLGKLTALANLSEDELLQIDRLDKEIAQIKSKNTAQLLSDKRQEVKSLHELVAAIRSAETALGETVVTEAKSLVSRLSQARANAEQMGADQFRTNFLTQTGGTLWVEFVKAAKALADAEAARGEPYPTAKDACLLCQQSLSSSAVELIQRIWNFLKSDLQERVTTAEKDCAQRIRELEAIKLDYFGTDSISRRLVESELPILAVSVQTQKDALIARKQDLMRGLRSGSLSVPPLIDVSLLDVESLINIRQGDITALENTDANERLNKCTVELRKLKHRHTVKNRLKEIGSYVARLKWATAAKTSLGSTRKITDKHTELFAELVTDRYINLFGETLASFRSNLHVTIETRGQKGERVRQISLNRSTFRSPYPADRVLSEGEKTAVAMADFLTESDLDEDSTGIILDDPITSLDNEWKSVLAERLAERSIKKQVIVFTHDLAFCYHVTKHAEKCGVCVATHWIQESDGRPGFVYADNSPVCEKTFRSADVARQCYSRAKDTQPQYQQQHLQQGFGALRTSYEALIIFELFKNVVARFEERISFDKLKDVRVDPSDVTEIVERMSALSRHIDAHLHSDPFASAKPTPRMLYDEIEAFEQIRARIKSRTKTPTASARDPNSGQTAQPTN